jgi:hypothetical protein
MTRQWIVEKSNNHHGIILGPKLFYNKKDALVEALVLSDGVVTPGSRPRKAKG